MSVQQAMHIAKTVLIKPFEGYHKRLADGSCIAYPDPGSGGDPWTIGYGSTGPNINKNSHWTQAQCEAALDAHILYFTSNLLKLSPTLLKASNTRFAAVISFVYNCGLGNYRVSTFKKRIDAGLWSEAAVEILKWNKASGRVLPGLTRRRLAESQLLL